MKRTFNSALILRLMLLLLCGSCAKTTAYDEEIFIPKSSLVIFARSVARLHYPVQIYAFNAEGVYASSQIIASATDTLSLNLSAGSYRILALSGVTNEAYTSLGATPNLSTTIAMKSGNHTTISPLMMGSADVTLTDKSAKVDIALNYAVTSITTALSGVPTEVETVSIKFSTLAETLTLEGITGGSAPVEIPCTKQPDNTWTHPMLYTFAGIGAQTVFSISITTKGAIETYGYTYGGVLKAGTPFVLQGSYKGGLMVDGKITQGEWGSPISIEFPFGPATPTDPNLSPSIPTQGSIWNACLVALVSNATSTSADLLLLSPREWTDLSVANASAEIAAYNYNDWTDWRIPTQEEAKLLTATYGMQAVFDAANKSLVEAALTPLSRTSDTRYLCNDALHTYALIYASSVMAADNNRTYKLRAIRSMRVTSP